MIFNTKIDLGYGNPGFIQEQYPVDFSLKNATKITEAHYACGKHPSQILINTILSLHKKYNNVLITPNTHIVVTVGAVQAIQAALAYFQSKSYKKVHIPKPYWGRFDDFLSLHNMDQIDQQEKDSVNFITSPNNPDGIDQSDIKANIRDACYNWPIYTNNVLKFSDEITIFSLSKLSGFSSTRIGWAVVQSEEIAIFMNNYVNIFTSGISIESQNSALHIMNHIDSNPAIIQTCSTILKNRHKEINQFVSEKNINIKILSNQGMFLYIQTDTDLPGKLNIETVSGSFFHDSRKNIHRINIGTTAADWNEFIRRLNLLFN